MKNKHEYSIPDLRDYDYLMKLDKSEIVQRHLHKANKIATLWFFTFLYAVVVTCVSAAAIIELKGWN